MKTVQYKCPNCGGELKFNAEKQLFSCEYCLSDFTEEQVKLFRSDFRIVADYFVQKRKNKKYIPGRKTIRHVDAVLKFMSVMTGDRRFLEVQKGKKSGGDQTMCEILDQIENRGIQKGMEIMRAEMAEKEASLAKKEAELARKEAQLAQAMELLKKYNIAFVS